MASLKMVVMARPWLWQTLDVWDGNSAAPSYLGWG